MFDITYVSHSFHSFHEGTPTEGTGTHDEEEGGTTGHSSLHSVIGGSSYHGTYHPDTDSNDNGASSLATIVLVLIVLALIVGRNHEQPVTKVTGF